MLTNHTVYKNETEYKGPFFIKQCFTNVRINLQCGVVQIKYNIRQIQPYISDTKFDNLSSENISDDVNICLPVINFCIK